MPTKEELEQEFRKYTIIEEAFRKAQNAANWAAGTEPPNHHTATPTLEEMQTIRN